MKIVNIKAIAFIKNLEKAYTEGVYADTPANRKLGRVGMSYKEWTQKQQGGNINEKNGGDGGGNGGGNDSKGRVGKEYKNESAEDKAYNLYKKLVGNDMVAEASSPEISFDEKRGRWSVELNTRPLYRAAEDNDEIPNEEKPGTGFYEDIASQIEDYLNKNFKQKSSSKNENSKQIIKEQIDNGKITKLSPIGKMANGKPLNKFDSIEEAKNFLKNLKKGDEGVTESTFGFQYILADGTKLEYDKYGDYINIKFPNGSSTMISDNLDGLNEIINSSNKKLELNKYINSDKDLNWNEVSSKGNSKIESEINEGKLPSEFAILSDGTIIKKYIHLGDTRKRFYSIESKDGNVEKIPLDYKKIFVEKINEHLNKNKENNSEQKKEENQKQNPFQS